jgi:hypothetical protein
MTERVEAVLGRYPHLAAASFASIEELLEAAAQLDLSITPLALLPTLAPEVQAEATLTWVRLPWGDYLLPIRGKTSIRIRENLLGQWEAILLPERSMLATEPTRQQAFAAAEARLAMINPDHYRLAGQAAPWRRLPPTHAQCAILTKADLPIPRSRGEASQLIDRLQAQRQARWDQPATSRQREFLERQGAWRDGMTKGEASEKIAMLKAAETPPPRSAGPPASSPDRSDSRDQLGLAHEQLPRELHPDEITPMDAPNSSQSHGNPDRIDAISELIDFPMK